MYFISTITNYFVWWYGRGLMRLFEYQGAFFVYISNLFSIKESLLHLLSPWKRLVGPKHSGLDGMRDWFIDNTISRGVGLMMRLILISLYLLSVAFWAALSLAFIVIWIFWPLLLLLLIYLGVFNA